MCIPLFEKEEEKDDRRFPGDGPGYREWEYKYWKKHGRSPNYDGEP